MDENPLITDILYNEKKKDRERTDGKYENSKMFLFSGEEIETFVPVPPESGTGGFRIIRLLNSLGIMVTDHKTGEAPFSAKCDDLSRNFKFTFNMSTDPVNLVSETIGALMVISPNNTYIVSPNISFDLELPPHTHQK